QRISGIKVFGGGGAEAPAGFKRSATPVILLLQFWSSQSIQCLEPMIMKPLEYPVERILMGPGPSNVPPRVLAALNRPLLGHLDPDFLQIMNKIQEYLRQVFCTQNQLTIPISGTGTAGMEAAVMNFVEEGDPVLVAIHGFFGGRLLEMMKRCGADCSVVESAFGDPINETELAQAAEKVRPRVIAVVHAGTSTGVHQAIEPIRDICRKFDSLLLVDAVTSLGGMPLPIDDWGIDICYSGTQKCLSCPPGLAPLTVSDRAAERLKRRKTPCPSWYLDLSLVQNYWGEDRSYHHTAPVSMNYALFEALKLVLEEGLEERWNRHQRNHKALVAGIEALGLTMHGAPEFRLWSLNTVAIPSGVDDGKVRKRLLEDFNLEIGAGLGALKGKVWRVGLMGENSRPERVLYFLHALEHSLRKAGFSCPEGAGVAAASDSYQ